MSAAATSAEIDRGRDLLHSSRGVVVLTGAGLSADSGLATFRGPGGLWRKYRPEELATPEAFRRDPRLVWEWYEARRRAAAEAAPNDAHRAIAEFALRRDDVTIVTQNVDGLHTLAARCVAAEQAAEMRLAANAAGRKAGAGGVHSTEPAGPPRDPGNISRTLPLELHGTFYRVRCTSCGRGHEHRDLIDTSSKETLPRCDDCGALLRPDVVWFGEPLGEAIERAFGCASQAEVCLVVGTSAVVQPAASVAMVTRRAGGAIIEVNPEETPLSPMCEVSLRDTAVTAVPLLLAPATGAQL